MDGVPYVRVCAQGTGWESAFPVSLTGLESYGDSLGGVKANAVGSDVMGSPTKKTKNEKGGRKQSYSGERLLSDVRANVDAAIEKNNHVTIVAFLLELGTCTRVDNCGAFTDNACFECGCFVIHLDYRFNSTRRDHWVYSLTLTQITTLVPNC